ncbi:hypothetical protein LUZ60_004605 [Juncus effusus]|nr:hypothetical protein LUZ60_004605 [Juncus effusus]
MAFANKIGNLIKQSALSSPSLYQAIGCMSTAKLFVGGLSYGTDEHALKEAFAPYGQVVEARVILDRESGRSRGFGFVTFTSNEEAGAALSAMDGKDLQGRMVRVDYATERTACFPAGGAGFSGGRGNYGSGRSSNFMESVVAEYRGNDDKFTIDATSSGGDAGNSGENDVLFGSELKEDEFKEKDGNVNKSS